MKTESLPWKPSTLTFICEFVGKCNASFLVREFVTPMLSHESPLVREGALYGIQEHMNEEVKEKVKEMAREDPSEAVRTVAGDICER